MHNTRGAHGAGLAAPKQPTSDKAPAVAAAQGFRDQSHLARGDFSADVTEGEAYALAYFDRLRAGMAKPGELAALLSFLTGEMLHGACRVLEKALEGRRHA